MFSRVLFAIESPGQPTGYGRIARELLPRLAERTHGVRGRRTPQYALLAWSHAGSGACEFDSEGYELIAPKSRDGGPVSRSWNSEDLEAAVQSFQPDVVVTVGNLRMLESVQSVPSRPFFDWVGYFPVEGVPLPSWRLHTITQMDSAVTFTDHGRQAVTGALPGVSCATVGLGVDAMRFRPLRNRERLRREAGLGGAFVVGCVARNQPRKQFPVLMEAFARLASRCREAALYLHADPFDLGWDLTALADHFGIADRTFFSSALTKGGSVGDADLNETYNLFDVFVLPTAAEGFGLPILESMAAGVPVVVTNHGGAAELVEGRGFLVEPKALLTDETSHTDLALLDSEDLAQVLAGLRPNGVRSRRQSDARLRCSQAGRRFAKCCSWDGCADRWVEFLGQAGRQRDRLAGAGALGQDCREAVDPT